MSRQIVQGSAADLAINDMRPVHHRKLVGHSQGVKAKDRSARKRIEKSEFSKRNKLALVWFFCREGAAMKKWPSCKLGVSTSL